MAIFAAGWATRFLVAPQAVQVKSPFEAGLFFMEEFRVIESCKIL
jgi:hypothetical protein